MDNELGLLIKDEVTRAEADFAALRSRAQTVLTASAGLVTLLGGLLAIAVGKDATLDLTNFTTIVTVASVVFFVASTVLVLLIYMPSEAEVPDVDDLATRVQSEWEAEWGPTVATILVTYLKSLRDANAKLSNKLALAIGSQVVGVVGVALMVLSLIPRL